MRAKRERPADLRAATTDLKDLFAIFPDLMWPRRARPPISDQILIARWRASTSRRTRMPTLAASETLAILARSRRR
jgi:hypothetical protein